MPEQLTFDLPVHVSRDLEDFFLSAANATAFHTLRDWPSWPGGKMVLVGTEGAGKSHLAQIWAQEADATILNAEDLAGADLAAFAGRSVAIEDADRIAGDQTAEAQLFHLHNLILAEGGALLVTARRAPSRWPLALPDLASRLEACAVATLDEPDDALIAAVLVKLFSDRQITVQPNLIAYLAPRLPRSLAAAQHFVERLDAAALAAQRPVTRRLAADLLDS